MVQESKAPSKPQYKEEDTIYGQGICCKHNLFISRQQTFELIVATECKYRPTDTDRQKKQILDMHSMLAKTVSHNVVTPTGHVKESNHNFSDDRNSLCLNFFLPTCPKAKSRKNLYLFKLIL